MQSWPTINTRFFSFQVAIKIIDKTQLNPGSLQKVSISVVTLAGHIRPQFFLLSYLKLI